VTSIPPQNDDEKWALSVEAELQRLAHEVERLNDLLVKVAGKVNVLFKERDERQRPAKAPKAGARR
jgi:hypothetical protein